MAKKLYYKIGEACKALEIQPYVLRYWEKEFPLLSPSKSKSGQRVYSEHELDVIRRIKELLYEEGYTIAGAKKKLDAELAVEREADGNGAGSGPSGAAESEPGRDPGQGGERNSSSAAEPASGSPAATASEDPAEVDTEPAEEIEMLRSGVREARVQAKEILDLLDAVSP